MFSKRQQSNDYVIVWGAFCGTKKCELALLDGKHNSLKHGDTLGSNRMPFVDQEMGPSWVFMQHCAFYIVQYTSCNGSKRNKYLSQSGLRSPRTLIL